MAHQNLNYKQCFNRQQSPHRVYLRRNLWFGKWLFSGSEFIETIAQSTGLMWVEH